MTMDELTIKTKMETLAEYHARLDLLVMDKVKLLGEITVPEEVQAIVSAGMKRMSEVGDPGADAFAIQIEAELNAIVIPPEIQAQLAEINRQRNEIMERKRRHDFDISRYIEEQKRAIHAEVEAQTKDVYASLAQRKRDIEAEFAGKEEAARKNIEALEAEIKDDVKKIKKAVKSDHYHAIYTRGRITWNTDKMEAWIGDHPFLKDARKEGDPSVSLKRI